MTGDALLLLLLLQVKHFLFDYVWQTPYQLEGKGIWGHPGGILHSGLHVLGTAIALLMAGVPAALGGAVVIAEFLVHYHLDWGKEQFVRRYASGQGTAFWQAIGFDQMLHHLTYVAIVAVVFR